MKLPKQEIFEIWTSEAGGEAGMHIKDCKNYDMLCRDVYGRKMKLVKTFKTSSWKYAKKVYNEYFGFTKRKKNGASSSRSSSVSNSSGGSRRGSGVGRKKKAKSHS